MRVQLHTLAKRLHSNAALIVTIAVSSLFVSCAPKSQDPYVHSRIMGGWTRPDVKTFREIEYEKKEHEERIKKEEERIKKENEAREIENATQIFYACVDDPQQCDEFMTLNGSFARDKWFTSTEFFTCEDYKLVLLGELSFNEIIRHKHVLKDDVVYTNAEWSEEIAKNKEYFDHITENASALEARRAEAYIMKRIIDDINADTLTQHFDYYFDPDVIKHLEIVVSLIINKYDTSEAYRFYDGYFVNTYYDSNCINKAECREFIFDMTSRRDNVFNKEKVSSIPFIESEDFLEEKSQFESSSKSTSPKINLFSDTAYIIGYNQFFSLEKDVTYHPRFRYPEKRVVTNENPSKIMKKGKLFGMEVFLLFDNALHGLFLKNMNPFENLQLNAESIANEKLNQIEEMYHTLSAHCGNDTCRSVILSLILKKRSEIYFGNPQIINNPMIESLLANDKLCHTKQMKALFNSIKNRKIRDALLPEGVLNAEALQKKQPEYADYIEHIWSLTTDKERTFKYYEKDPIAENAVKEAYQAIVPNVNVQKVVLPYFEEVYNSSVYDFNSSVYDFYCASGFVIIENPLDAYKLQYSLYSIRVCRYCDLQTMIKKSACSDEDRVYFVDRIDPSEAELMKEIYNPEIYNRVKE